MTVTVCKIHGAWWVLAADTVRGITVNEHAAFVNWADALDFANRWRGASPMARMVWVGP